MSSAVKVKEQTAGVSFQKVLFATDFSKASLTALPYALTIVDKYSSKLVVAHVIPYPQASPRESWDQMVAEAECDAKRAMSQLAAEADRIPDEVLLEKGNVRTVLLELIEARQADLVVIGTHGHNGLSKLFLGSVAEQVFRQAPCPVLTVGPNVSTAPEALVEIHEILYATDFMPESLTAAAFAISLAQQNQAHLSLLHVIEDQKESTTPDLFAHQLYDLIPYKAGLLCRPTAFVKYGDAVDQILELARDRAADLIVLGVKQASAYPRVSTHLPWAKAHRIVAAAHCPVLTIRGK